MFTTTEKLINTRRILLWAFLRGRKIENEASTHQDGYVYQNFNIPYIEKVEPLTSYLVKDLKQIDISLLFDFLVDLNVSNYVESEYNN